MLLFSFLLLPLSADAQSVSTNLGTGLVAYWKMDESSGVRYSATSTNTLSDNNTVGSASGIILLGADFERSNNEWLSIVDASQTGLDFTGQKFAFNLWFKPESLPTSGAGQYLFWKGTNSDRAYGFWYEPSVPGFYRMAWYKSGNIEADCDWNGTGPTLVAGTQYMITINMDVSNASSTLYVNGTSYGTKTCGSGTLSNSAGPFEVGGILGGGYADGVIDEMGAWSRILTSSDVSMLYNSGVGLEYTSSLSTTTLPFPPTSGTIDDMISSTACAISGATTTCVYNYATTSTSTQIALQNADTFLTILGLAMGFLTAFFIIYVWKIYRF